MSKMSINLVLLVEFASCESGASLKRRLCLSSSATPSAVPPIYILQPGGWYARGTCTGNLMLGTVAVGVLLKVAVHQDAQTNRKPQSQPKKQTNP